MQNHGREIIVQSSYGTYLMWQDEQAHMRISDGEEIFQPDIWIHEMVHQIFNTPTLEER